MKQLQQNTNQISQLFASDDPTCQFKYLTDKRVPEGVELNGQEQEYLLPHFLMLLVGKPGSGKTTMLQHLLYDKGMYKQKFDKVLFISPSASKSGLKIQQQYVNEMFDMQWIFEKLEEVNKQQADEIYKIMKANEAVRMQNQQAQARQQNGVVIGQSLIPSLDTLLNVKPEQEKGLGKSVNSALSKFWMDAPKKKGPNKITKKTISKSKPQPEFSMKHFNQHTNKITRLIDCNATVEQKMQMKKNVLVILDDVISDIKHHEHDSMLCQLFLNRRHLIANGTVSFVLISQKYTKIPAIIRSQASWLILFKLNPNDFEIVQRDIFIGSKQQWQMLLEFTFGKEDEALIKASQQRIGKSFDNLGIFVEKDIYFKNFGQITFK